MPLPPGPDFRSQPARGPDAANAEGQTEARCGEPRTCLCGRSARALAGNSLLLGCGSASLGVWGDYVPHPAGGLGVAAQILRFPNRLRVEKDTLSALGPFVPCRPPERCGNYRALRPGVRELSCRILGLLARIPGVQRAGARDPALRDGPGIC